MKCQRNDCVNAHELYYEAIYVDGNGQTTYDDGYTCSTHEPIATDWDLKALLQLRSVATADCTYWSKGETISEYNPCNYKWSDSE